MNTIIKIENVSKQFKSFKAVKNITLNIEQGELFGLIGPNGAGKTTMFKMLLGLLKPSEGRILYDESDLFGKWDRKLRTDIGYLPENVVFYDHLTGRETLEFFAKLKGVSNKRVHEVIETLGIAHYMGRNVKDYSKGMRQRIGLAQAILGNPKILFLDEPTTGLDPQGVAEFFEILFKLKKSGTTIIMTSHILREIQGRVDRLGIMLDGRLHAVGSISKLKKGLNLDHGILVSSDGKSEEIVKHLENLNLELNQKNNNNLLIKCIEGQKIEVLEQLLLIKNYVKDIEMYSPGLDDVFLNLVQKGDV